MATYLILNTIFIVAILLLLKIKPHRPGKAFLATFGILIVLTLVFDNIMISLSFFEYEPSKILGIKLWQAPVEDFMYAVLAVLLVPTLWQKLGDKHV